MLSKTTLVGIFLPLEPAFSFLASCTMFPWLSASSSNEKKNEKKHSTNTNAFSSMNNGEWDNVHVKILVETDYAKQGELRHNIGSTVDYYLTSMSTVTETGALVHSDLPGSKVRGVAFGTANVIVLMGSNKLVKDVQEAHKRIHEFAVAAESARARDAYGVPGSGGQWFPRFEGILQKESGMRRNFFAPEILVHCEFTLGPLPTPVLVEFKCIFPSYKCVGRLGSNIPSIATCIMCWSLFGR